MVRKHVIGLCILALCLSTISCKELYPNQTGPLAYEKTKFADAIPQEYGPLISVTLNPQAPSLAALWFQKPDGTITMVLVDTQQGKIGEKALTIPRK